MLCACLPVGRVRGVPCLPAGRFVLHFTFEIVYRKITRMANTTMNNVAIVILAAGESSRYGSPKQLLDYKGKSLLIHSVDAACGTGCEHVFVVLGARIELMKNELKDKPVVIIENEAWQEGMASSIRCGVKQVMKTIPVIDDMILMVCDQPLVSHSLLLKLIGMKKETGKPNIACLYGNNYGIPVLFHKSFFATLLELKGDKGARKLILDNMDKVATVPFPGGAIDIDTEEDYQLLKKEMKF